MYFQGVINDMIYVDQHGISYIGQVDIYLVHIEGMIYVDLHSISYIGLQVACYTGP
jgi:hypothetical protein